MLPGTSSGPRLTCGDVSPGQPRRDGYTSKYSSKYDQWWNRKVPIIEEARELVRGGWMP